MVPSDRFKPVHSIAKNKEQRAAKRLGISRQSVLEAEAKLRELHKYRQDYLEQFKVAGQAGMHAARLQEYQTFLARLNEAIRHQETLVRAGHEDRQSKQDQWLHRRTRSKALGKVLERYVEAERKQQEKREQKETDEHAQRSHRFKKS